MWHDESLHNDVIILDSSPNVCVFKVNDPCVKLPSD